MPSAVKIKADNRNIKPNSSIEMVSNVARDAKKRASDFRSYVDALYETIANAYEAYDIGDIPIVNISIDAKKRKIVIEDKGIGMSSGEGLKRYFALHAKTTRRQDGLNMRGYNGTGKVAPFKFGGRLEISTVKDGLRTIAVLTMAELNKADKDERPPQVKFLVKDHPTDDENGTVITITQVCKEFDLSGAGIREIKDKISTEQMMWMKNAVISVNGDVVPFASIPNVSKEPTNIKSPCGNFDMTIYYSSNEMPAELQYVFMSAGRVFLARENFGKEGSKYSPHIHVDIRATEEWAEKYFYDKREEFVSEDRSLKLKLTHPEAIKMKEFAEIEVSAFISELAKEEEIRRRECIDEHRQEIAKELSQIASSMHEVLGGRKASAGDCSGGSRETHVIERTESAPSSSSSSAGSKNPTNKSSIGVIYDSLGPDVHYRIEDGNKIVINLDYPTIKAVGSDPTSPLYKLASLDVIGDAMVELVSKAKLREECGDDGEMSLNDFFSAQAVATANIFKTVASSSAIALLECSEMMDTSTV